MVHCFVIYFILINLLAFSLSVLFLCPSLSLSFSVLFLFVSLCSLSLSLSLCSDLHQEASGPIACFLLHNTTLIVLQTGTMRNVDGYKTVVNSIHCIWEKLIKDKFHFVVEIGENKGKG